MWDVYRRFDKLQILMMLAIVLKNNIRKKGKPQNLLNFFYNV
jgi:hypothetical protein